MRKTILTVAGAILLAISCAIPAYAGGENQLFGTVIGAGLGGLFGSQFGHGNGQLALTAAGAVGGAWAGNEIGRSLDNPGVDYASRSGSGYAYSSSPSVYYQSAYVPNYVAPPALPPDMVYINSTYNSYCREFSQLMPVGDRVQEIYATACLQPDGTWRIVQ